MITFQMIVNIDFAFLYNFIKAIKKMKFALAKP